MLLAMRFDFVQNVEDAKEKGVRKEKGGVVECRLRREVRLERGL